MAIKDILLPLVGEPSVATVAAIDKCMALAGGIGARVTAIAVEQDILVRPKVTISADLDNTAAGEAVRSVSDAHGFAEGVRYRGNSLWLTQRAKACPASRSRYPSEFCGMCSAQGSVAHPGRA